MTKAAGGGPEDVMGEPRPHMPFKARSCSFLLERGQSSSQQQLIINFDPGEAY